MGHMGAMGPMGALGAQGQHSFPNASAVTVTAPAATATAATATAVPRILVLGLCRHWVCAATAANYPLEPPLRFHSSWFARAGVVGLASNSTHASFNFFLRMHQ